MALPLSSIPRVVSLFSTSLASSIGASDTSLTLSVATDDAGNAISGVVGLTCDGEIMIGTKSGTSVTGILRGIDPQDGTTEVTALKAAHQRGAVIKITSAPFLNIAYRLLNGTEGFPNKLSYASAPTITTSTDIITKAYADALALAGVPNATTTVQGALELATAAELTAGTATGATGASLAGTPATLAAQIQSGTWITLAETASGDDAYTATTTPTVVPAAGMFFFGSFATANTTGATLSVNSETPVAIQKVVSGALGALETGDIIANVPNLYYRTASVYVLLSPLGSMPSTAILSEMATFFGATDITGAEAETLTAGYSSDASAKHVHKSLGYRVYQLGTTGTTSPETLFSYTLPAGRLGTKGAIRLRFSAQWSGNSMTATIKLKFGSTELNTFTFADASTITGVVQAEMLVYNDGSTSSQRWINTFGTAQLELLHGSGSLSTTVRSEGLGSGTASVDTTAEQTVTLVTTKSNTGMNLSLYGVTLEVLDAE